MSSVSGSGSSDQVRRNRDEYKAKEEQLEARHRAEVQRLNKQHTDTVKKLEQMHNEELERMQSSSLSALNDKDIEYQRQIDDIRKLQLTQTQNLKSENRVLRDADANLYKDQIAKQKLSHEQQEQVLRENHTSELAKRDDEFQDYTEATNQKVQESQEKQRERLTGVFDKEMDVIRNQSSEKVKEEDRERRELRRAHRNQLENQKLYYENRLSRQGNNFRDVVERQSNSYFKNQELQRTGYNQVLNRTQDRFNEALSKNKDELEASVRDLGQDLDERYAGRVQNLELLNQRNDEDNINTRVRDQRLHSLEKQHLADAHEKEVTLLTQQRQNVIDQAQSNSARDIAKAQQENHELLDRNTKFYKSKMEIEETKNRENMMQKEMEFRQRYDQVKKETSSRVDRLAQNYLQNQEKSQVFYEQATDVTRKDQDKRLQEIRMKNLNERNQIIMRNQEVMDAREKQFEGRIERQQENHTRLLAGLEKKYQAELNMLKTAHEKQINEVKQGYETQIRNRELQNDQQIKRINSRNDEEKKMLNKQYEERLNRVISGIQSSKGVEKA